MARLPFCICGVRGGDLKVRVNAIMANERRPELTRPRRAGLALGALALIAAPVVAGALTSRQQAVQGSPADRPRFEVASIRRTTEERTGGDFMAMPGGRLRAANNPVSNFIGNAYGFPRARIANLADWLTSERYDLDARAADAGASEAQMMVMLQVLLEERFKLRVHREVREGPVYTLSVANGGHRLRESQPGSCVEFDSSRPGPRPEEQGLRSCGNNWLRRNGPNMAWSANHISSRGIAGALGNFTRSTVIDKTGLIGFFDIELELPPLEPAVGADSAVPDSTLSPFTVLREQLGLVLEPGRGPLEYLVIDAISKPSPN